MKTVESPTQPMLGLFARANLALEAKKNPPPAPPITRDTIMHVHALAGFLRRTKANGIQFRANGIIVEIRREEPDGIPYPAA
jgi:hypothetical protein